MATGDMQLAGGTVTGRDHRLVFKNNQDAYAVTSFQNLTIAVVADGCSGGAKSEVGAQLGVRMVTEQLARMYAAKRVIDWRRLEQHLVAELDTLARSLGGDYRQTVEEYLLFTLVGVVITNESLTFFACGDGALMINGVTVPLGPYPGNMPPYIAYRLLMNELRIDPGCVQLAPVATRPIETVESFLIGTDGVHDVITHAERIMPGLQRPVGNIAEFWTDDRYFRGNPDLVSRQLRMMARDFPVANPEHGLLHDDTTLVVGRRAPVHKEE